jgi:transposase
LTKLSQKSDTTAAGKYALGRWEALTRSAQEGGLDIIDHNAAERALRAVALGRRNYLFPGSDRGREHAATLYRLIDRAKLINRDPEKYLREVLSGIAKPPINPSEDLLPWKVGGCTRY